MSGFSPEWLSLREPADHRSRNGDVLGEVVIAFSGREHITIADLACGTGSNLRGLIQYLPKRQTWRLVDSDPYLLAAAHQTLIAFADEVLSSSPLRFRKQSHVIDVNFEHLDLEDFSLAARLKGHSISSPRLPSSTLFLQAGSSNSARNRRPGTCPFTPS